MQILNFSKFSCKLDLPQFFLHSCNFLNDFIRKIYTYKRSNFFLFFPSLNIHINSGTILLKNLMEIIDIVLSLDRNILIHELTLVYVGIYELMKEDWQTYCLMSAIIFIEEMNKPHTDCQTKYYKNKPRKFLCFSSVELRMIDKDFLEKFFEITLKWQRKLDKRFIGNSFDKVRIDKYSGQYKFILSPTWLGHIIKECGRIPNAYSLRKAIKRIKFIRGKNNEKVKIDLRRNLSKKLFEDKFLAAGAFIISFDTEFRGIQTGLPSLCMSDTYKDFLEFMLKVAKKWNWTK